MSNATDRSAAALIGTLASIRARVESRIPGIRVTGGSASLHAAKGSPWNERWCDSQDLVQYDDEEFIGHVYRQLFGREPDSSGREYYLGCLRANTLSKMEILRELCDSEEGRLNKVHVIGLDTQFIDGLADGIADDAAFVRAVCRKYFKKDPDPASVQRWTTLLQKRLIAREDMTKLFSRCNEPVAGQSMRGLTVDLQQTISLVSQMRQELSYHQRALEHLLSHNT